jgi:repressor LexA
MMPDQLTDLEQRILDYLVEYLRTNTYQPSIREIGREFSIKSTKTVSELLQSLADKGWIERDPSRSRGVRLLTVHMRADTVSVPVYDNPDSRAASAHFELDRKLVSSGNGTYMLVMGGDHLREEGILPGDMILIERLNADDVQDGDLVVARTAGSAALRRCHREGSDLVLEPVRRGEVPLTMTARMAAGVIGGRAAAVVRSLSRTATPGESVVAPIPVP